jgi:hypothetical protein
MVAARALSSRVRRPATLLVVAILATALSSALPAAASPAAAGGTPMPAGVPHPDGGKPMPLAAPNGPSGTACQILIGKAAGPKHLSPVLSSECAKPGERLTAAATNTLLMVWYTGYNYSGRSTKIYGVGAGLRRSRGCTMLPGWVVGGGIAQPTGAAGVGATWQMCWVVSSWW